MISKKFYIQSFLPGQEIDAVPERWYNLNGFSIGYGTGHEENTLNLCFSLTLDLFQKLESIITAQDQLPTLWINNDGLILSITTRIKNIKIVVNEWKKWVLPECYIQLEYPANKIKHLSGEFTTDIDQEHIVREGVQITPLVTTDTHKLDLDFLCITISLEKNLFPFLFYGVSKTNEQIAENVVDELKKCDAFTVALELKKQPDFTALQIINCDIDNIINMNNQLCITGGGSDNSQLVFSNSASLDTKFLSINDYFMHLPIESKPMKDKTGAVAFEL